MTVDRSGALQRARERVGQNVIRASAIVTPLACALMAVPARAQAAAAYVNPFAGGPRC
jgi:hypothetical protein